MYLTEMEMSVKDLHKNTKASVTISMEQVAQVSPFLLCGHGDYEQKASTFTLIGVYI